LRPEILFPLFAPATSLSGVGPRFAKLFETLTGGPAVIDLCWHLPSGIIDRRYAPPVAEAMPGRIATLTVEVGEHRAPPSRRQPYRVLCHDASGSLELVFFHAHRDYLMKALPPGQTRVVSGKVEVFNDRLQMTHPDHIGRPEEAASLKTVEPVYPLTAGLTLKTVGKAVQAALKRLPQLPEWLDPALKAREGWPTGTTR
jgi:ATP-dependent DNA helicase RecG